LTITNQTKRPINFNVYAADAYDTRQGGFALHVRTDPKRDVGAWIQLPLDNLTVPGLTAVKIPFSISPPANATPGDHTGGILAEDTTPTLFRHGALSIAALHAVGVRVYARVAGPLHPSLQVTGVHVDTQEGVGALFGGGVGVTVDYTVVNTGNVRLDSIAHLSVSPLLGADEHATTVIPRLLPRGSATLEQHFSNLVPFVRLRAQVYVVAQRTHASAAATEWVVPWLLLAPAAVLAGGLVWWFRRRRGRRPARDQPPEPGGHEGGVTDRRPREVTQT
jgi:hypothetical protein